jgi:AcrR family transcriptional regulator
MTKFSGNRERIVGAAYELFWSRGYHATSIADIAEQARLPKGSIYNYFRSKDELLVEALSLLAQDTEIRLRDEILAGPLPPGQVVARLLAAYERDFEAYGYGRGDPLASRLDELADTHPQLVAQLRPLGDVWRRVVTQKIWGYATVARIPGLVEHAEGLATMIHLALLGVLLEMKASHSPEPLREARLTLVPMVDNFVSAVAAGDIPPRA